MMLEIYIPTDAVTDGAADQHEPLRVVTIQAKGRSPDSALVAQNILKNSLSSEGDRCGVAAGVGLAPGVTTAGRVCPEALAASRMMIARNVTARCE
ncbi:MAG: hypothetical protein M3Y84_12460 [Acidobacteriota bacterium]|nr:hypothetical protein [Acidobacteriota bacterium]